MVGFLIGTAFGAGVLLIVIGCFAMNDKQDAYNVGYYRGFIDGTNVTAEKEIAEGVCDYETLFNEV